MKIGAWRSDCRRRHQNEIISEKYHGGSQRIERRVMAKALQSGIGEKRSAAAKTLRKSAV